MSTGAMLALCSSGHRVWQQKLRASRLFLGLRCLFLLDWRRFKFSISLKSPDQAAEQMSRFSGSCKFEMWGECVSASKARCWFPVVHPPSWPDPMHGNINIQSCTSAPKCTWWNIFFDIGALNRASSKCNMAPIFFFFFGIRNDKNRTAAKDPHTKSHDKPWRRLLLIQSGVSASLQSVKYVHKASTLVWPIYNQRNTSLLERIPLLTVGYFLYSYFIKPGIFLFTLEARVAYAGAPSCRSPVWRVPQVRPRVGDLQSIFHPEALFVSSLESGEVTQQSDGFQCAVCQDDLIGRIDLWLCKTERQSGLLTEVGLKAS